MKTLYLECMSGIAGDMTVAALLDLGADEQVLRQGLASLGVEGYSIQISRVNKSGIDACKFDVRLHSEEASAHDHAHTHDHEQEQPHDHGHSHDHGKEHSHSHDHGHPHDHGQEHSHEHSHSGYAHAHPHDHSQGGHGHSHSHGEHLHRNLPDINAVIDASAIAPRAKELAKGIFRVVAEAEAKIHGRPVEEVHFHEVGAVDSIVDIVGTAICLDNLGITRVASTPLREGTGTVRCQHGLMPVPAPATLEITRAHKVPLVLTDNLGEMVTPTGAAIVAALVDSFQPPRPAVVEAVGYGAGTKDFKIANVLRASLLEEATVPGEDEVLKLECNLDDMTGEELAWACERLLAAGALDVWCTPIYMKKSRPAQLLSVLVPPALEEEAAALMLELTSTIGVRVTPHRRHIMERREKTVETIYGQVVAKETCRGKICKTKVEFESAKKLAEEKNVPVKQILDAAYTELNR